MRRGLLIRIDGDGRAGERALFDRAAEEPFLIGRVAECNLRLAGDARVGRRHCVIRSTAAGWILEDLASSGGTFMRGERIAGEHRLAVGDVIELGNTHLTVLDLDHAAAPGEIGDPQREDLSISCRGVTFTVDLERWNLTSAAAFDAALAAILDPVRAPFDDPCALVHALRDATEQLAAPVAGVQVRLERRALVVDANALALLRDPGAPTRAAWDWLRETWLPTIASPAELVVGAVAPGGVSAPMNRPPPSVLAAIEPAPLHVWMHDFAVGQLLAIHERCRVTTAGPVDVTFDPEGTGWEVYDHLTGIRGALVAGKPLTLSHVRRLSTVTTIALID